MTGAGALLRKGFVASSGGLAKGFVAASVSEESSAAADSAGAAIALLVAGAASDGSFLSACMSLRTVLMAAMIAAKFFCCFSQDYPFRSHWYWHRHLPSAWVPTHITQMLRSSTLMELAGECTSP